MYKCNVFSYGKCHYLKFENFFVTLLRINCILKDISWTFYIFHWDIHSNFDIRNPVEPVNSRIGLPSTFYIKKRNFQHINGDG